ncbi:PA domain-containing protein [Tahibacter amnicola]|uniref:Serine protease n=1 Tax=Tahibacter amnicola TaxID=2976241 RepID=A0ABY6BHQ6_9GAMM|nr:PA domain-containing protein [Tahibacter amnicola]UXI69531.1 serine protease [Tahibacter amnicola]
MTARMLSAAIAAIMGTALFAAPNAQAAAVVQISNQDGAGEGFNDPAAPNAAAGCQAGDTLGACRLRVFQVAAEQWGRLLNSNVTIVVQAAMNPLTCSGTSAVLGSAGPLDAFSDFPNAPRANTAYVSALANSLAAEDLDDTTNDINTQFNVTLDAGTCLNGTAGWWYSTDPSIPVPADRTPLLPVVFHEIGHGLGFTALYSATSGASLTGSVVPAWGYYLYDTETAKLWKDMTNAERVASTINDPDLVWTGPRVNKQSPKFLGPPAKLIITAPAAISGNFDAQTAEFGPSVATSPVTGDVVLVDDGSTGTGGTGTVNDGCETPFVNAAAVSGKVALIDRGTCNFAVKVKNAQLAGATAVVIANNAATGLPGMAGSDATITIPSLGVAQATGTSIKANLGTGVTVTLGVQSGGALAGTRSGCVRMNAPNPVQQGSSVSHFHPEAFPNLLMEPSLNRTIFDKVDLTLPLFEDIGWKVTPENLFFFDGFDPNPCTAVQP